MIPFFVAALLYDGGANQNMRYVAAALFIIASLTDMLDGKIARKYNLVTNFGKFMDPLADKLLVCSALICMIELRELPAWMVIIIISREFIISGFRLVASDNGVVIAASYWGKFKTTFQMIGVVLLIFNIPVLSTLTTIIVWIALALTVISLVDYIVKNAGVLTEGKIYGKSETEVKEKLQDLLKCGGAVVIYTRRRGKDVHVLAETQAEDEESAKAALKPVAKEIKKALGDMYYSTKENETMEETVVRLLTKYGLTVTTAESCTGGMVAAKIINVPGASDVFDQGYITYSNKSKRKILDVSKATLKKYGAVSEQTAREMALGGVLAADADACVAVTGLAGPDGGTEEKPVGLVYVSCCMKDEVIVEECHFNGTRQEIREHAAVTALDLLRRMIIRSRQ